jgi:hypothetical protein
MSNDGSIKHPVSDDRVERFMGVVYVLATEFGIKDVPEVYHFVELLGESVARHVFEKNHKMSPQRKVHSDRQRFIAIFKTRYQQLLDLEYVKKVTPVEGKQIHQTNKELLKEGFTPDEFLEWLFETFLVDNPNFCPPTIKSSCSQFILHSFFTANREVKDARKRQELERTAGMDLIQRARGLLRTGMGEADEKKIRETLKGYGERSIMLSEFRKVVEGFETTYGQQRRT